VRTVSGTEEGLFKPFVTRPDLGLNLEGLAAPFGPWRFKSSPAHPRKPPGWRLPG
jgi:hypothetical protein